MASVTSELCYPGVMNELRKRPNEYKHAIIAANITMLIWLRFDGLSLREYVSTFFAWFMLFLLVLLASATLFE